MLYYAFFGLPGKRKKPLFLPLHAQLKDWQLCKAERMLSISSENKTAESFHIEQFKIVFLMKSSISKKNKKHSISSWKIRQKKIVLGWSELNREQAEHKEQLCWAPGSFSSPLTVLWTPSMFPWINLLHLLIFFHGRSASMPVPAHFCSPCAGEQIRDVLLELPHSHSVTSLFCICNYKM